jgi:hypothetical protein
MMHGQHNIECWILFLTLAVNLITTRLKRVEMNALGQESREEKRI